MTSWLFQNPKVAIQSPLSGFRFPKKVLEKVCASIEIPSTGIGSPWTEIKSPKKEKYFISTHEICPGTQGEALDPSAREGWA